VRKGLTPSRSPQPHQRPRSVLHEASPPSARDDTDQRTYLLPRVQDFEVDLDLAQRSMSFKWPD